MVASSGITCMTDTILWVNLVFWGGFLLVICCSCFLLSLKNLWICWWLQANLTGWRRSEKYEADTGCAAEVGTAALTIPSAGQVRPPFCPVSPPAIPTQLQTRLSTCCGGVNKLFHLCLGPNCGWPACTSSDSCYRWRWAFGLHSLDWWMLW